MKVRDLWEVLTFQVSWADSNIFIVLIAVFLWMCLVWFIVQVIGAIGETTFATKEDSDEELEHREKRALWSIPFLIGFMIIFFIIWWFIFIP